MQIFKKFDISKEEIVPTAQKMKDEGKKLIMIHGYIDKQGEVVISYQYNYENTIEAFNVKGEKILPTISKIYDYPAIWPENEIAELMDVKFEGLETIGRFFIPESLLEESGQILVTPLSELRLKTKKEGGIV